jgi:hypothetical protein
MMAPNRVKLEMLEQRIGQRRDATRALPQVPTGVGQFRLSHQSYCWPERGKSQGYGDSVPISKEISSQFKKELKKDVDKRWGVLVGLPR